MQRYDCATGMIRLGCEHRETCEGHRNTSVYCGARQVAKTTAQPASAATHSLEATDFA